MMIKFLEAFGRNYKTKRQQTLTVTAALVFAVIAVLFFLEGMYLFGFWGLVPAILVVGAAAYRIPRLAWYWGKSHDKKADQQASTNMPLAEGEQADTSDDNMVEAAALSFSTDNQNASTHEDGENFVLAKGVIVPRETPQGTKLTFCTPQKAVMEVKAAIRFWCWFLPTVFLATAIIGTPVGAAIGFNVYSNASNSWNLDPVSYTMHGALWWLVVFLALTFVSFSMTRLNVQIIVLEDTITFGGYKFDRRFAEGLRIGYETKEIELPQSFLQPKFGMVALRFKYGPWGEDMKYLVNAYHSNEVVTWVNQIIDTVGVPEAKRNDPYAGRKIELL